MALDPQIQGQIAGGVRGLVTGILARRQQEVARKQQDKQESNKVLAGLLQNKNVSDQLKDGILMKLLEGRGLKSQIEDGAFQQGRISGVIEDLIKQQGNPDLRQQSLETLTGQRSPEDIQFNLAPERQARIDTEAAQQNLLRQRTKSSRAQEQKRLQEIKRMKTAKSPGEAFKSIEFVTKQAQSVLKRFQEQVVAGTVDPGNPGPEVLKAQKDLRVMRRAAIDIGEGRKPSFKLEIPDMTTEELLEREKKLLNAR
jgi:hypothetical protein